MNIALSISCEIRKMIWGLMGSALLLMITSGFSLVHAIGIGCYSYGNLFVGSGQPSTATASFILTSTGSVTFSCVDYWGVSRTGTLSGNNLMFKNLPPGWYWMTVTDSAPSTASTAFGVVAPVALSSTSRVAADAASAWLVSTNNWTAFATIVKNAGISRVRNRISWTETEPTQGAINWGRYVASMESFRTQGVKVSVMFSDSPSWARAAGSATTSSPVNLTNVYNWTKAAATQFASSVDAWEAWNEEDYIGFWTDGPDRFAGLQKAAYLGFKAGNPNATVLSGALCGYPPLYGTGSQYESGVMNYADRFNWHIYVTSGMTPTRHQDSYIAHRRMQDRYSIPQRASWVSEAGIILPAEADGNLSSANQKIQARFALTSIARALAAGNEKNFFFVLPYYKEGSYQYGCMYQSLTPYPALVALSAASKRLGDSTYYGQYYGYSTPSNIEARLFSRASGGDIMALWNKNSTGTSSVTIPVNVSAVTVADLFGAETSATASGNLVTLQIGQDPIYVSNLGTSTTSSLARSYCTLSATVTPVTTTTPSGVFVTAYPLLPFNPTTGTYQYGSGTTATLSIPFYIEAYNFTSSVQTGTASIVLPTGSGWTTSSASVSFGSLQPKSRSTGAQITLTPSNRLYNGVVPVSVQGNFPTLTVSPTKTYFSAKQYSETSLNWLDDTATWNTTSVSPGGWVGLWPLTGPSGISYTGIFSGTNRWAYPSKTLTSSVDMSSYQGIAAELLCEYPENANTRVTMSLFDANGLECYMYTQVFYDQRTAYFIFPTSGLPPGFDFTRINRVTIGVSTNLDKVVWQVRNIRAVKFQ